MVDKNLFLYDLAVVAIMKDEEPYVKEWLDYHLLAGVDHFYIYDNDSKQEFKKILQPYIDAGIVTYTFFPGKCGQMGAYLDAIKSYRFFCRYMAFIDGDEFIFPKSKSTIIEVVDEVLNSNVNAVALCINWALFGPNGQEKADYIHGVLERFTTRSENLCDAVKTIADPRKLKFFNHPHNAVYLPGKYSINEEGKLVLSYCNDTKISNKIIINHYYTKSKEEWYLKAHRGRADLLQSTYETSNFDINANSDIFDDEILNYQKNRYNDTNSGGGN